MNLKPRDPLLTTARLSLTVLMGLAALVGAALLVAAPALFLARAQVLPALAAKAAGAVGMDTLYAMIGLLLLIAAMAALAFVFLQQLRRIVDSVRLADPFAPVNAARLARMGWITLAIEALSLPIGALGSWLADQFKDATADFGISFGGLLLALVLFILARVFRQGAAMRDELEGTV